MIQMISNTARAAGLAIAGWGLTQVSAVLRAIERQRPAEELDDPQPKPVRHLREVRKRESEKPAA